MINQLHSLVERCYFKVRDGFSGNVRSSNFPRRCGSLGSNMRKSTEMER